MVEKQYVRRINNSVRLYILSQSILKNRNNGLDLLRGMSILYIVGYWHLFNYTGAFCCYKNGITYRVTWIVLGIFVLISGYLMGKKNISMNKRSLLIFYKKRLIRIYPLYCLAIILFYVFNLSRGIALLKAMFGVSMFIKPSPPTLWFVAMLIVFYIISPFFIVLFRIHIAVGLIGAVFILLIFTFYGYGTRKMDLRLLVYLPSFLTGMLFALKYQSMIKKKRLIALLSIVSILISYVFLNFNRSIVFLASMPMITICPLLFLMLIVDYEIKLKRKRKLVYFISYISYSMYLFHRPIYVILKNSYFPKAGFSQVLYLGLFCFPLIILISYGVQRLYDSIIEKYIK